MSYKFEKKMLMICGLISRSIFVFVLLGGMMLLTSCGKEGPQREKVIVLCGGSMRAVLENIKKRYEKVSDDEIVLTFGGSGDLCAQIQETGRGDVYLCHDPFMPWAYNKKLISEWEEVATLNIVIIVPKGDKKIQNLKDLSNEGVRLGIGNQTYSTSGQIVKHLLSNKPYGEKILKNVRVETKGHQQRCNDVILGTLDASIVWGAVAALYPEKLDIISINMDGIDAMTSATYKNMDAEYTGVTVGIIKGAEKRKAVRDFYKFFTSEAKKIFKENGFAPPREAK